VEGTTVTGPKDVPTWRVRAPCRAAEPSDLPSSPRGAYAYTSTPTGLTGAIVRSGATRLLAQVTGEPSTSPNNH
jgi:hypothetical protein